MSLKIAMIHGQNHKGSTYHIGKMLADKIGGEVEEFFLPKDFGEFCVGCGNCFGESEVLCPHYSKLTLITKAMDEADVLILTSPVYVYHATGSMKAWLDHYGYRWMVHRPDKMMFSKQAVCIATAAGAGMKSTIKDMADSLFFWGIPQIYKYGVAVRAVSYEQVNEKIKKKIETKTTKFAKTIIRDMEIYILELKQNFFSKSCVPCRKRDGIKQILSIGCKRVGTRQIDLGKRDN